MTRRRPTARRGAVAPFMSLCLLVLLGVLALTLDGGMMMHQRQLTRTVADTSALAAADKLFLHYPAYSGRDGDGSARLAALAAAAAAGYANDGVDSSVAVNIPPSSGAFAGRAGYAEVVITSNQSRGFSALWGSGRLTVTARAVARGLWVTFGDGIIVLDPTAPSALNVTGGGQVNVANASVIVDSNDAVAANATGGSIASASEFDVTGGYSGTFIGPVYTGAQPSPDPLAYLAPPDPSTLTLQSNKKLTISNGNRTLQPGVYRGGIQISGNANVTLSPGIYYMDTGGFSFGGGGSTGGTLIGNGVLLYNAPDPKNNSEGISINGNNSSYISMSPPTSGPYQGISLFQDRTSTQSLSIAGNGDFTITGTFYAAAAQLSVAGNGTQSTIGSQYISDTLTVSGGGALNINWTQDQTARTRYLGLVE
jgi:Putative Flp pilus-assembly TadE/G-like